MKLFYNPLGECILFGMNEPEEMEKILLKLNDIAKDEQTCDEDQGSRSVSERSKMS